MIQQASSPGQTKTGSSDLKFRILIPVRWLHSQLIKTSPELLIVEVTSRRGADHGPGNAFGDSVGPTPFHPYAYSMWASGRWYWVGQNSPFSFFHKIKDTFFIFTNNFIDLDILSMLAVSRYWLLVGRGQECC